MAARRIATLVLSTAAIAFTACSPDGTTAPSDAPTTQPSLSSTSTTTATPATTLPVFVTAYPDVAVEVTPLADGERPYTYRTLAEAREIGLGLQPTAVTFGSNMVFAPARVELVPPIDVEFINESDRSIEIEFDWDELVPLSLSPGDIRVVSFTATMPKSVRYSTVLGNAKVSGAIVAVDGEEDEFVPDVREATDLTGSMRIKIPDEGPWRTVAGYRSIVVTSASPLLPLGSTAYFLRYGSTPLEETLRIDAADGHDADTAVGVLAAFDPPAECENQEESDRVRTYSCGDFELTAGFIEGPDGVAYTTVARDLGSQTFEAAIASLEFGDSGAYADPFDIHPSFFVGRQGLTELDIHRGSFGAPATILALDIFYEPDITLRNFTDAAVRIYVNGQPFIDLPANSAAEFSADDFATSKIGLSLGTNPLTRVDLSIDTSWRQPLPLIEMTADFSIPEMEDSSEVLLRAPRFGGDVYSQELIPADWRRVESDLNGFIRYERQLDEADPAAYSRGVYPGQIEGLIRNWFTATLRSEPTTRDSFAPAGLGDGGMVRWEIEGRPTVTLLYRQDEPLAFVFILESSPDDHDLLMRYLLGPAATEFRAVLERSE